jgi:hypothetical protein
MPSYKSLDPLIQFGGFILLDRFYGRNPPPSAILWHLDNSEIIEILKPVM